MSLNFIFSNDILTIVGEKGNAFPISKSHHQYNAVRKLLFDPNATEVDVINLIEQDFIENAKVNDDQNYIDREFNSPNFAGLDCNNSPVYIAKGKLSDFLTEAKGRITIVHGQLYYEGQVMHDSIRGRVDQFIALGLPFDKLLRFAEKVYDVESMKVRDGLLTFLDNKSLPITDDGCFLAYKSVTEDYLDKWTGDFDNSIGNVVWMNRKDVNDDPNKACSDGLHVGSLEYVRSYCSFNDKVIIVKVDPRDAVSVPKNDVTKMRVCRYEVVADFTGRYINAYVEKDDYNLNNDTKDNDDIKKDIEKDYDWSAIEDEPQSIDTNKKVYEDYNQTKSRCKNLLNKLKRMLGGTDSS